MHHLTDREKNTLGEGKKPNNNNLVIWANGFQKAVGRAYFFFTFFAKITRKMVIFSTISGSKKKERNRANGGKAVGRVRKTVSFFSLALNKYLQHS